MTLLITYLSIALLISFLCSVLEAVLLSSTHSYIETLPKEANENAISLLKELNLTDGLALREQSYPAAQQHCFMDIIERLCLEGLLLKCEDSEGCTLSTRYRLSRPFYELTLYDVLHALGEEIKLSVSEPARFEEVRGPAVHRLEVLESTVRYFLTRIRLVDMFVSDSCAIADE